MDRLEAARVLDRAPMLFRSSRNFAGIREEAVAVRAVDAVDPLHQVQVPELASIEDKVIRARDLWNAINREANRLINDQEEIDQQKWNDTHVDYRRRQNREEGGI